MPRNAAAASRVNEGTTTDSSVRLSRLPPQSSKEETTESLLQEVLDTLQRMLKAPEGILTHHSDDPKNGRTENLELTFAVSKLKRAKSFLPRGTSAREELSAIIKIAESIERKSDAQAVVDRIRTLSVSN